jgi:hypothetical protein
MLPVLHLDPVIASAGAIGALAVFRDQAFEPHHAGMPEHVSADLALLEIAQEDAIDPPSQQPGEVGLAPPLLNPVFEITKHWMLVFYTLCYPCGLNMMKKPFCVLDVACFHTEV